MNAAEPSSSSAVVSMRTALVLFRCQHSHVLQPFPGLHLKSRASRS